MRDSRRVFGEKVIEVVPFDILPGTSGNALSMIEPSPPFLPMAPSLVGDYPFWSNQVRVQGIIYKIGAMI